jgi:DNA-directed RNA polymerase specialized sigma24 family protein
VNQYTIDRRRTYAFLNFVRDVVALDEALEAFSKLTPRQAKVVELCYFGGLSEEETAEVLNTSTRTVRRVAVPRKAGI